MTTVLDTLYTIPLSCKSSQICTVKLYSGLIHVDQYLARVIFSYQTTLLVTMILVLIVAIATPSPQGILYLVLTVHSMLEATNSRQQISKYSMKQSLKELYPELLTLCFSLLLFVCLWRYDFTGTQFELLPHPSVQFSLFFTSHHPSRPYPFAPLGKQAFFFHFRVSVGR